MNIGGFSIDSKQQRESSRYSRPQSNPSDPNHLPSQDDQINDIKQTPSSHEHKGLVVKDYRCKRHPTIQFLASLADEDHTADIRIRAWGDTFAQLLVSLALGMENYMTDTDLVEFKESRDLFISADNLDSLLFHYLDEILFLYGSEYFIVSSLSIIKLARKSGTDCPVFLAGEIVEEGDLEDPLLLVVKCYGEKFDRNRHTQGTEIKAITMHDMNVCQLDNEKFECTVLVDI